jgi:hypothetical protein
MSLYYDRVEIETLKWLKTNPKSPKTLAELHEMVSAHFEGTKEELGNKYVMMELEGLVRNGAYGTPAEITKEGLIALRGHLFD